MLKDFDEFVRFCFEHGGHLRNHKAFGNMAQRLREKIASLEIVPPPLAPNACPYCEGKGKEPASGIMVRCRFCGGSGKRE